MLRTNTQNGESLYKILIVDDESSSIHQLSSALESLGTIVTANSGEQALLIAQTEHPDLVLLDIQMPGINGFEVCDRLRAIPELSSCAIIFVTAFGQLENEIASLSHGGIDFITKPFDNQVVLLRVKNQLVIQAQAKQINMAYQEMSDLVNHLPNFISYWDKHWNNLFSNHCVEEWFGFNADELKFQPLSLILPQKVVSELQTANIEANQVKTITACFETLPLGPRYFHIQWSQTVFDDDEEAYLVTISDISDLKKAEQSLISDKEYLNLILNSVAEAVIATDENGTVTYLNPRAEFITGWKLDELQQAPIENVMELKDIDSKINVENPIRVSLRQQRTTAIPLNTLLISKDGRTYQIEQTASPIRNHEGRITGAVSMIHDISQSTSLALLKNKGKSIDPLTHIANRMSIREQLTTATDAVRTRDVNVAVAVVDIDHFKFFNSSHGNVTGDMLLKSLARRLHENYEPVHSVGRLGSDEFMVILRGFSSEADLIDDVHVLLDQLRTPFSLENQEFNVTVSIGVSIIDKKLCDPDTAIQQADAALYRAKFEGGDRYRVFTKDLEKSLLKRRSTEETLRYCLQEAEHIEVYYQPKVNLITGRVVGAEALVRLKDQSNLIIPPSEFIPIAEETGLIVNLGKKVLNKACFQAAQWHLQGYDIPIAVNVSAVQCLSEDLVEHIRIALYASGLNPSLLELEVTETAFIRDIEDTLKKLKVINNLGIDLSIDDFGKGYSNLTNLRRLNIAKIKLDMSYVKGMLSNPRDYDIVKAIIALSQSSKMEIIAEGIETTAIRDELIKLGCTVGQGYLYSKPITAEEFMHYLEQHS